MATKKITIEFEEYTSPNQLSESDKELLNRAIEATKGSYSPYSGFSVGAALRLSNGEILSGSNQENAAFPSGLCAERTAIFYAHANYPSENIETIAVTAVKDGKMLPDPTFPCGACRQVMAESQMRAGKGIRVIVGGERSIIVFPAVEALLPFNFDNFKK